MTKEIEAIFGKSDRQKNNFYDEGLDLQTYLERVRKRD